VTASRLVVFALGIGLLLSAPPFTGAQQAPPTPDDLTGYRPVSEATAAKTVAATGTREGHTAFLGITVTRGDGGRPVVEEVQPDSPAAKAGIKKGDVIDRVGDHPVKTPTAFREWLLVRGPGDTVKLGVVRDGERTEVTAKLVAATRPMKLGGGPPPAPIGATLTEDKGGKGIFVEAVTSGSAAASAGLKVGDQVLTIDGLELSRPGRLADMVAERKAGDTLALGITRDGKPMELKATLAAGERQRFGPGGGGGAARTLWTAPSLRLAVVCVEFSDTLHNAKITPQELDAAFFSHAVHYGKDATGKEVRGSLGDYFREQSAGAFRLEGRVFDWVAVAKKRGDYIQGSGTSNKTAVLVDALEKLTARDGEKVLDGFDALAFVYAGDRYRTNRGAVYYPHAGSVTFKSKSYRYMIGAEGGTSLAPIGTFVKPLCEVLGLPELAARTENVGSEGLGVWCAMSNTFETNRPQHLSAWCKEKLGWVKPTVVDPTVKQKLILSPIEDSPKECLKVLVRPDGSEYFLLENRRKKGFDSDLPAEGLLIWRVVGGRPILEESHGIDGPAGPTSQLSGVPYPSPSNAAFTPDTLPSSRSPHGGGLPVHVTNIRRQGDGRIALQIGYEFR
jgi:M6 family metalloprotease-like protein